MGKTPAAALNKSVRGWKFRFSLYSKQICDPRTVRNPPSSDASNPENPEILQMRAISCVDTSARTHTHTHTQWAYLSTKYSSNNRKPKTELRKKSPFKGIHIPTSTSHKSPGNLFHST